MKRMIIIICGLAAFAAVSALGLYVYKFGVGFASKISDWGAVGDFFGGVLNPTFALLSLILIAYTLMQNKKALDQGALALEQSEKAIQQGTKALEQSEKAIQQGTTALEQNEKALNVSNTELTLTRKELTNSAKALEEQAKLIAVQSFETTFFNMLDLLHKVRKTVSYNPKRQEELAVTRGKKNFLQKDTFIKNRDYLDISAFTVIIMVLNKFHINIETDIDLDAILTSQNRFFSNYFRTLHQILSQIDDINHDDRIIEKYINILKSQLSNQELALLLLYCIHEKETKRELKKLVIKYKMLENLDFEESGDLNMKIKNPDLRINLRNHVLPYLEFKENKLVSSAFGEKSINIKIP